MKNIFIVTIALLFCSCGSSIHADFEWSPMHPKVGMEVMFIDHSDGGQDYSWNFGDMNIGSGKSTTHIYKDPGSYIVELSVTSGLRSDTKTVTIVVSP